MGRGKKARQLVSKKKSLILEILEAFRFSQQSSGKKSRPSVAAIKKKATPNGTLAVGKQ